jgi:hypothetical protein
MKLRIISLLVLPFVLLGGCTAYQSQFVSFRPPEAYTNRQQVDRISIAGEGYANKDVAEKAFGFDIRGAGLLPVQLVMDNKGKNTLEIVTGQTFLIDQDNRYWPVVPNHVAVERLEKSTQLASIFGKGAGKGALLGAAGGAILGAALGIVSGKSIGGVVGKGAALGAAGGAVIGGVKEGTSPERERTIIDDIRDKGLENKAVPPDYLANGFLFFPGEATSAKEIRLMLRERETGATKTVNLVLE